MDILVLVIGILVSIIYLKLTNISPGGIFTTGVFMISLNSPQEIIFTIFISFVTYIIMKIIYKFFIIYKKSEFVLLFALTILANYIMNILIKTTSFNLVDVSTIGYLVPTLTTMVFLKQGIKITLPSIAVTFGIGELICLIGGLI